MKHPPTHRCTQTPYTMPATSAAIESDRTVVVCWWDAELFSVVSSLSDVNRVQLRSYSTIPLPPGLTGGEGFRSRVAGCPNLTISPHRATSCVRGGAHRTEIACPLGGWPAVSDLQW